MGFSDIIIRRFGELSNDELYEILRAREAVFVVEQNCPYFDIDGKDKESFHIFIKREDGSAAACLRVFMRDIDKNIAQIGRVVTTARGCGLGGRILHEGVVFAREKLNAAGIYLEAQCYAIGYYAKEGFEVVSGEFLEDGIPHVKMFLDLKDE